MNKQQAKEIGTCKDCKWWGGEYLNILNQRACLNKKMNESTEDDGVWNGWSRHQPPNAFGPDFGCIHWEKKE